jgi:hypothetical protein
MPVRNKTNSFFGFLAAAVLSLFTKSAKKTTTDDLRKAEFKTSSQNMGVRFTKRIRDVFRLRWIRKL